MADISHNERTGEPFLIAADAVGCDDEMNTTLWLHCQQAKLLRITFVMFVNLETYLPSLPYPI